MAPPRGTLKDKLRNIGLFYFLPHLYNQSPSQHSLAFSDDLKAAASRDPRNVSNCCSRKDADLHFLLQLR